MSAGTEASIQSLEVEAFARNIPSVIAASGTLFAEFDKIAKTDISHQTQAGSDVRGSFRVPLRAQAGQAINQGSGDGDSLGTGNFSQYVDLVLSPVYLSSVEQHSRLSAAATRSKDRAILDVVAKERANGLESTINGLEALLYSDGSGSITQLGSGVTISSNSGTGNATSFIQGVNALVATDNQKLSFFNSEGGASLGSATVSTTDGATSTIWFSTPLPAGVAAGTFIVVNGASGAPGSSILGTTNWVNSAQTGVVGGVNRSAFPSRISSPSINKNGGSLVGNDSQVINALMKRVVGTKGTMVENQVMIITTGIEASISESTWYNRQLTNALEGGSGVPDTAKKGSVTKFGGRRIITANAQPQGRIDVLNLPDWSKGELVPLQPYFYGDGMTVFPVISSTDGTVTTAFQSALECDFQIATGAPRRQLFLENVAEFELNG